MGWVELQWLPWSWWPASPAKKTMTMMKRTTEKESAWASSRCRLYSSECVEEDFSELRLLVLLGVPHFITPAAANAMPKLCPNHPGKMLPERYNSQP